MAQESSRKTRDRLADLFRHARRSNNDPLDTALVAIQALVAAIRADQVGTVTTEITWEIDRWARDFIEQNAVQRDESQHPDP